MENLSRERARFDGTAEAPLWLRASPVAVGDDEVLLAVAEVLADPEVQRRLEADDEAETYPDEVLQRLRERGLSRLFVEVDGPAPRATAYHQAALCLLAAQMTTSLGITLGVNCLALISAYLGASPSQREEILGLVRDGAFSGMLLTELEPGSDLLRVQARAEPGYLDSDGAFVKVASGDVATHYRLRGEKQLINGATKHRLLFAFLRTRDEPAVVANGGSFSQAAAERSAHAMFWLERQPGVVPLRRWRTLPARAADISGLRFEDVILPVRHRLGEDCEGFALVQKTLSMSRGGISALAVGTLTRARSLALGYARQRTLYGAPIGELGAIADHLVRLDAAYRVASAVSLRAMAWANAAGLAAAQYTAVAKLIACELAEEGVDEGRRVLGGRALLRDLPYERLVRDVLLYGVFDGTSHLMLEDLQMRLSIEARRRPTASDSLEVLRGVYALPARSLVEAFRKQPQDPRRVGLVDHIGRLAGVEGAVDLSPLVDVARELFALTAALKAARLWGSDQGLRHDMARAYALVEALCALVELCDPDRRAALGLRSADPHPSDGLGYRHALACFGGRVCELLVARAAKAGVPAGGLAAAQRAFLAGHDATRRALGKALLASP